MNLHPVDLSIVLGYLLGVILLGLYLRKRAAQSISQYFLAGKKLHWLYIGMSGSVGYYDVSGTMWNISMIYIMGMKSMWIFWSWCFLLPVAYMTFGGKWARRSNVMTGAEWMLTRFGRGLDGQLARLFYSIISITFTMGMCGYAFQGIGKFIAVYYDFSAPAAWISLHLVSMTPDHVAGLLIISITAMYVILGGFYSVVFTDVLQTVVLTIAAFIVMYICYVNITFEQLQAAAPEGWLDMTPSWNVDYLANTEYQFFMVLAIAWVVRGLLVMGGGPVQLTEFQRFLSTRSVRDASKVGMSWGFFLFSRWGMMMGIAALAIIGIDGLHGSQGTTDPEKVLPFMLNSWLPIGVKGFVLAGFIAAFMSTFDSNINSGASSVVKDIYQQWIHPTASEKQLSLMSYVASLGLVSIGLCIGFFAEDINQIWMWILMVLFTGFMVPNILRWFWWRFNAWGVVGSIGTGMVVSLFCTFIMPRISFFAAMHEPMLDVWKMGMILVSSLIAAIAFSYATPPTDRNVLQTFFQTVQPGGFWKPVRQSLGDAFTLRKSDHFPRDLFNTALGMVVLFCYFYTPVYGVIHYWSKAIQLMICGSIGTVVLYFTWWKYLPED
jgi:solute:Na+ symporter, SSS family